MSEKGPSVEAGRSHPNESSPTSYAGMRALMDRWDGAIESLYAAREAGLSDADEVAELIAAAKALDDAGVSTFTTRSAR